MGDYRFRKSVEFKVKDYRGNSTGDGVIIDRWVFYWLIVAAVFNILSLILRFV